MGNLILAPLTVAVCGLLGVLYHRIIHNKTDAAALYIDGALLFFCMAGVISMPLVKLRASFTLYMLLLAVCTAGFCAAGAFMLIRPYLIYRTVSGGAGRSALSGTARRLPALLPEPGSRAVFVLAGLVFLGLAAEPFLYEPSVGADLTAESAAVTLQTDTLFEYNPATGAPLEIGIYPQSKLQVLPLAYAAACRAGNVRIPVLLYRMIPLYILCLAYLVAWKWSGLLFGTEEENRSGKRGLFLLFFGVLLWLGDYYNTTYAYRLLHEAWKGGSILLVVVLPYLAYLCMELIMRGMSRGFPLHLIGSILLCLAAGIFLAPWKLSVVLQGLCLLLFFVLWGVRRGWLWLKQRRS